MLRERISTLIDSLVGVRREEPHLNTSLIKHVGYIAEMCDISDEEWDNFLWTFTKIRVPCNICGRK